MCSLTPKVLLLGLLLLASCSTFSDAVVTNSCSLAGKMNFATGSARPTESEMLSALDDELLSTDIASHADQVHISSALAGDLPFPGGWGYVQWEGAAEVFLFRIPASDVEPVPVVIPRRVCP